MCVFVIKFNSLFSIFYYLVALVCFQRVKFFIDVMIILFTFTIVIFNFYFAALLIAFFFILSFGGFWKKTVVAK